MRYTRIFCCVLVGGLLAGQRLAADQLTVGHVGTTRSAVLDYDAGVESEVLAASTILGGGEVGCGVKDSCGDACDSCCGTRLLGWLRPSDHCYDDFISPMTNPFYFEDPRTLTEARAIFVQHRIPPALSFNGADQVRVIALQLRAALTERLSVIATKDGFIMSDSPLIADGWADINAGLKYNLFSNPGTGRLLSAGVTYELPVGSTRSLQGNGDGLFHLFLTGGTRVGDYGHWISASGFLLPSDRSAESSMWYWSNHYDIQMTRTLYFLTEANWYHWMGAGDNAVLPGVEGLDVFNFGSQGVAGNDIVTGAIGLKYKPSGNLEAGVAFEFPLTDRRDIIDNRLTADIIFRY